MPDERLLLDKIDPGKCDDVLDSHWDKCNCSCHQEYWALCEKCIAMLDEECSGILNAR